jgi:hypothetical protein
MPRTASRGHGSRLGSSRASGNVAQALDPDDGGSILLIAPLPV